MSVEDAKRYIMTSTPNGYRAGTRMVKINKKRKKREELEEERNEEV